MASLAEALAAVIPTPKPVPEEEEEEEEEEDLKGKLRGARSWLQPKSNED
jgi:hypothetical protein